ncbi:MAG: hypothetical protein EBZ59_01705 [Planctomycetia bacterium]|nr:hypothetical protein [Planctomycetia bacterium]
MTRLALFTLVWTAAWVLPVARLSGRSELLAGLIPFAAFGLRVFAGFFAGVPAEDPVRRLVRPLLDWIDGRAGVPPYAWVLDATVALGLVWLGAAFDIPRRSRIATAWIIPTAALLSVTSLVVSGLPIERLLSTHSPAVVLACAIGGGIGAVIRWTPSPIPQDLRTRAAIAALLIVPTFVAAGGGMVRFIPKLPPEHASQAESIVALMAGAGAALLGWNRCGFVRPRSRFLFAMAVGVAAGAVVALYA